VGSEVIVPESFMPPVHVLLGYRDLSASSRRSLTTIAQHS
jgi:hypothetical protein